MNIKIKHFQKKTPYSSSGKNKLLATLGLVASLGIAGCETTSVTSGVVAVPESSSSAEAPEGGVLVMPESSSSEEPPLAGGVQIIDSSSSTDSPKAGVIEMPESSSSSDVTVNPVDIGEPLGGTIQMPTPRSSSSTEAPLDDESDIL